MSRAYLARVFFTVANRLFSWLLFFFGLVEERGHSTVVPTESGHSYPAHHRDTQIATRGSDIRVIQAQSSESKSLKGQFIYEKS